MEISCEHSNDLYVSVQDWKFLDQHSKLSSHEGLCSVELGCDRLINHLVTGHSHDGRVIRKKHLAP